MGGSGGEGGVASVSAQKKAGSIKSLLENMKSRFMEPYFCETKEDALKNYYAYNNGNFVNGLD